MPKELDGTQSDTGTTVNGSENSEGIIQKDSQNVEGTTGDGTQKDESITVEVEKESLKDVDPDDLTDEQLENIDLSEFEVDEEEAKEKVKVEKEPDPDTSASSDDDDTVKETDGDAEKGDPLKDTKAALTREQQRRADLEKENQQLRTDLRKVSVSSFQELSDEQLTELKYDDPDAYVQYKLDKRDYESSQKSAEQDIENDRIQNQFSEITSFAKTQGIDVENEKNLKEFLSTDKFKQLDQFIMKNLKPNEGGLYSSEQMGRAYKMLFLDESMEKAVADAKLKSSIDVVDNISKLQKNGGGGSDLDRIKKSDSDKPKAASELDQSDIDLMSESELSQYEKELAVLEAV